MRLNLTLSKPAKTRLIFPALLLALLLPLTSGHAFTGLYVFGDSLSDTGRNPATPSTSYYNGRFCNGPLWVEYLSAQLGLTYNAANNFAVSGSTTSNLLSQIAGLTPSPNLATGLFTLASGGNDILINSPTVGVNDAAWGVVVTNAFRNMTNAISAIYTSGGREILVGNLAFLGKTPSFLDTPAGYSNYIDSKVAIYNLLLASGLTNVVKYSPGLRIYALDLNQAFTNILNSPSTYGFTVTSNGALEDPKLTDKSFTGPGANYVFWDSIHPTTKVDTLTAAHAFADVSPQMTVPHTGSQSNLTVLNLYPGLPYTIQTSTNLLTWTDYQTVTPASTNAAVVWTNGVKPKLFYRVKY
ncbi:MAG TPA: SGNH/GDSL hydrolase family protein [Verrucomicrobiae bacterium]|nr:SGNH/GDSL hydrolase family protein [Verrucomicrobiae bacterium]